jgi:hypothetical protein
MRSIINRKMTTEEEKQDENCIDAHFKITIDYSISCTHTKKQMSIRWDLILKV